MIRPFGEAGLLVETPDSERAQALASSLRSDPPAGVRTAVPGLESVLVEFDPFATDPGVLERELAARLEAAVPETADGRLRTIPVVYGGVQGPDLQEVAARSGLSADEVVRRHLEADLRVLFLGFAPGFAYLGDLPSELHVPRLATPRTQTPSGSVAIAGRMSGIYPAELPGGWPVIGRTPLTLFDPGREPPAYLLPGDRVRFVALEAAAWDAHAGAPHDW